MKFKFPENRKKEIFLSLIIILSGNLLGAGMFLWENRNSHVHSLPRKEYGLGSYEKTLTASTSESTAEIQVTVEEQQYSQSQIEEHLKAASEFLTQWFKSNVSSQNILNKDLDFPSQVPDNPAGLSWSTSSPEFLSWKGRLGEDIPSEGVSVNLRCTISIGENETVWEKTIMVTPPSLSEAELFEKAIQQEAENITDEDSQEFLLPSVVQGKEVTYRQTGGQDSWKICLLSLFLGLGIFPLAKERERQAEQKRFLQMQKDYPDIVQKLILFLRAGLSIRMAVEKLAKDYLVRKEEEQNVIRYAYEEIVKTWGEMEGGVYEKEAYERFGRRCGLAEYKALSVLLVQNLKKGNQSILELLEREAVCAGKERLRRARIQGEEASTKLLLPMILQLFVVLIILMVPAFISFF